MGFDIRPMAEIFALPEETSTPIVDRLLYAGLTTLTGDPKGGKSMLASQVAASVGTGQDAMNYFSVRKQGPVLYLLLDEMPGEFRQKLHRAGYDTSTWSNVRYARATESPLRGEDFLNEMRRILDAERYSLIVVDMLVNTMANVPTGNAYVTDYAFLGPLHRSGADHSTAILALHHTNKGAETGFRQVSGSQGMTGAGGGNMLLRVKDEGDMITNSSGVTKVGWLDRNGRLGFSGRFSIRMENSLWIADGSKPVTAARQPTTIQILRNLLEDLDSPEFRVKDLPTIAAERGLSLNASTMRGNVSELARQGVLVAVPGGSGLYRVVGSKIPIGGIPTTTPIAA
jgi:hypothetical protein